MPCRSPFTTSAKARPGWPRKGGQAWPRKRGHFARQLAAKARPYRTPPGRESEAISSKTTRVVRGRGVLDEAEPHPISAPGPDGEIREGLMVYVADVIETQLRNLDEAKKAKREADQREGNGGTVLTVVPSDDPTPEADSLSPTSPPDPVSAPRPMLEGDRRREEQRIRNLKAAQDFDARVRGSTERSADR